MSILEFYFLWKLVQALHRPVSRDFLLFGAALALVCSLLAVGSWMTYEPPASAIARMQRQYYGQATRP